eukprot:1148458-Pelagomonas_calceolata.AAC.5
MQKALHFRALGILPKPKPQSSHTKGPCPEQQYSQQNNTCASRPLAIPSKRSCGPPSSIAGQNTVPHSPKDCALGSAALVQAGPIFSTRQIIQVTQKPQWPQNCHSPTGGLCLGRQGSAVPVSAGP